MWVHSDVNSDSSILHAVKKKDRWISFFLTTCKTDDRWCTAWPTRNMGWLSIKYSLTLTRTSMGLEIYLRDLNLNLWLPGCWMCKNILRQGQGGQGGQGAQESQAVRGFHHCREDRADPVGKIDRYGQDFKYDFIYPIYCQSLFAISQELCVHSILWNNYLW